ATSRPCLRFRGWDGSCRACLGQASRLIPFLAEEDNSHVSEPLGIEFSETDRAGVVRLNRPGKLNALSREMFEALSEQYTAWAPNPHIYGVYMESTHPQVFCSGGDLKSVHAWCAQGALSAIREFYRAA